MTRIPALAAALLLATTAQASEPGACQSLAQAEADWSEARDHVEHLIEVAFSDDFDRRLAFAKADDRDAMVAEREDARASLPDARKGRRDAKKSYKQASKDVDAAGVVCTPAPKDDVAKR